jgi:hypothetical protein
MNTYDTVPDSGNSDDGRITTYGNNDEMPGVKVKLDSGGLTGVKIRVAGLLWNPSSLVIYPIEAVPGAEMPTDGVYITGERIEEPMVRRFNLDVEDARERHEVPDSLGSDVCWVPVSASEFEDTRYQEYLVDEWDGGNRQHD